MAVREPMTGTMQSLVYDKSSMPWDKSRGFALKDMPLPVLDETLDPADGENVLVKVVYAGFCGSDRGIWNRTAFKGMIFDSLKRERATTRIIGHEMVGEIVAVGSKVTPRYGYRPKDIVSTESHIICGTCYQCRIGQTHICDKDVIIGIGRDGCFAEYIKLPANVLWPTDPRKIRMKVAAVQEPLVATGHACSDLIPGEGALHPLATVTAHLSEPLRRQLGSFTHCCLYRTFIIIDPPPAIVVLQAAPGRPADRARRAIVLLRGGSPARASGGRPRSPRGRDTALPPPYPRAPPGVPPKDPSQPPDPW